MTQQPKPIPSLNDVFMKPEQANAQLQYSQDAFHKHLEEQKQHPAAWTYEAVLAGLPETDKRKQAVKRAAINGETPNYERIWKEHQP